MNNVANANFDVAEQSLARVGAMATLGHPIAATPYQWREPGTLPRRSWILGRWLLRGTLACVVAPGGAGKSTLLAAMALSLATGRSLLNKVVHGGPKRVWLWNLEDDLDELSRSLQAAALHFGIEPEQIAERLFVDSGLDGANLCTATEGSDGFRILEPIYEALTAELIHRQIDVLFIDPFVSSHEVEENANTKIDKIAKTWARVGKTAGCTVVLVHHTSKAGSGEVTAMSARGAVALINAARSTLVINRMDGTKASELGMSEAEGRCCISVADDKHNRAPPEKADWYRFESVDLGNGSIDDPGDNIAVAVPWALPRASDGITDSDIYAAQALIDQGSYRFDPQATEWVGHAVAEATGLDIQKDKPRIKALLKIWFAKGWLRTVSRKEPTKGVLKFFVETGIRILPASASHHLDEVGGNGWGN
jgi:hypothetical protein